MYGRDWDLELILMSDEIYHIALIINAREST